MLAAFVTILLLTMAAVLCVLIVQPPFVIRVLAKRDPSVLFFVEVDERNIALTIDDGPHPEVTPRILDVLARFDARATFFLIGERVLGNEEIVRRIVEEGHEIGNHMMSDFPSVLLRRETFLAELAKCHEILTRFDEVTLYRPGSGWYTKRMRLDVEERGYRLCLASIYPQDTRLRSATRVARYIRGRAHPGGILVLHDGTHSQMRTVRILETVLPWLSAKGYEVVTVSELRARSAA